MRKKHQFSKNFGIGLAVISTFVFIPSCIDELYDLNNGISSEMALGGDSLSVPIGSTDTIKISDFLNDADIEMLKTMEDGGYGLSMKDSLDVNVPKIDQTSLTIADKTFAQSKTVSFGDISMENFKIPGDTVSKDISMNLSSINMGTVAINAPSTSMEFSAGLANYAVTNPTIGDQSFNGGKDNLLSEINLPADPGGTDPVQLSIPFGSTTYSTNFGTQNNLSYSIEVPSGVTGINRIDLAPGAIFEIAIELAGADGAISSGQVIPDITINPSDLFIFSETQPNGVISFGEAYALTPANHFKATKALQIDALKITETPSNNKLNINKIITTGGTMTLQDAKVWSNKISAVAGMDLKVSVSIKNVAIGSMAFNIPSIQTSVSGNTNFDIDKLIPSEISKVNNVKFNNPGKIAFDLQALLPTMESKTIKINNLTITFPKEFVFSPDQQGVTKHETYTSYTLSDYDLGQATSKTIPLYLDGLDMSGITLRASDHHLVWNAGITYTGTVSFDGRINSSNIPSGGNDAKMSMGFSSNLSFESAEVVTNNIDKALPNVSIPISFDAQIAKEVKELNVVNLSAGTKLRVNISKPALPLSLQGQDIQIKFPPLFVFNEEDYNLGKIDRENVFHINGTIPSSIELGLSALNIGKELTNGVLSLDEVINVSGGVRLAGGTVNSKDINALTGSNLSLKAMTSDFSIASATIQLNSLSTHFADTTSINLSINDLPDEIIALDSIILGSDATIQLNVNIPNMPNLSNPLHTNMTLTFPKLLQFAPGQVNADNQLIINQDFAGKSLSKTVKLKGLHFDGKDLNGKLDINETLGYNVNVSVQDPTVNSAELTDDPISVNVDVKLSGIKFESVYGKVNPGIEPVNTHVELSDLPEFMKGEDVVLDITKPVLVLETQSNLEIPIDATMTLTPKRNGTEITSAKMTLPVIKMPKARSASSPLTTHFWIAPEMEGMPENYIYVPADIQKIFKTVPDDISFVVNAQANMEEEHHIDLNADYNMKVKYDVTVPMAFGKDLMIEIRDTISNLDESIGDITFSGKGLEIFGTILNSIPLDLTLTLKPLDKDNKPLAVDSAVQVIRAGARNGSAVSSNLSIKINDPNGLMKNVRGFELIFKANSNETVAGTPIKPDNFIKADLKVRMNGGISIGQKNKQAI